MITIRKASTEDFELIHSLAKIIWPHTYKTILSPEQLDYMFEMMYSKQAFTEQVLVKNHNFLLADEENVTQGFASYEVNYTTGNTKIHKIYVLPGGQGKGVGRALLNAVANIAKKHMNTAIVLNVNRYNPAVHFYKKLGFTKAGEEDISIGNGYLMEDYIMRLEI